MHAGESCLASSQTQEVFSHKCSWSIATVAMIAVVVARMKRHQREAAGTAMNSVQRGEGANKPDWPVDCSILENTPKLQWH